MHTLPLLAIAAALLVQQAAPSKPAKADANDCPLHEQHMKQSAEDARFREMNVRGDRSMGFEQQQTTHHFRSADDGGAIEVTVKEAADSTNLEAIRKHLRQVAADFAKGDFRSPLATHAEMPAGADAMQRLKGKISYRYEEMPLGARVRISTKDTSALEAVRQFLGYQVTEHRTGDAATHKH
jgi:hypothetical protein